MISKRTQPKRREAGKKAAKAVLAEAPRIPLSRHPARHEPAVLLAGVATALNACEEAGILVKLAHGSVITASGYVFPLGELPGERYEARTRMLTQFPVPESDED